MEQGHTLARDQLQEIADASEGSFEKRGETIDSSGAYITFEVTLPFQGIKRMPSGIPVNARERFLILVHNKFPFKKPIVYVPHRRFAGFPHVQGIRFLCLYQSLSDWKPEAGMYGFIERLDQWIHAAALDQLDPEEAPLHPPVAYTTAGRLVIPVADAPMPDDQPWFGYAALRERGQRTEIIGWRPTTARRPELFAAAILVHERLPFEFPRTVREFTDELKRHGIDYGSLIRLLAAAALHTAFNTPMLVVLGTPMRRVDPGVDPCFPILKCGRLLRMRQMNCESSTYSSTQSTASRKWARKRSRGLFNGRSTQKLHGAMFARRGRQSLAGGTNNHRHRGFATRTLRFGVAGRSELTSRSPSPELGQSVSCSMTTVESCQESSFDSASTMTILGC